MGVLGGDPNGMGVTGIVPRARFVFSSPYIHTGTTVQDLNRLLKQFMQMRELMKRLGSGRLGRVRMR